MFRSFATACALCAFASVANSQETARVTSPLPDGTQIIAGTWRKAAPGAVDIPFGFTFASPPIVLISPVYPTNVGFVEAVGQVQNDRFTVNSPNAASNYFVNWIAIGKK